MPAPIKRADGGRLQLQSLLRARGSVHPDRSGSLLLRSACPTCPAWPILGACPLKTGFARSMPPGAVQLPSQPTGPPTGPRIGRRSPLRLTRFTIHEWKKRGADRRRARIPAEARGVKSQRELAFKDRLAVNQPPRQSRCHDHDDASVSRCSVLPYLYLRPTRRTPNR